MCVRVCVCVVACVGCVCVCVCVVACVGCVCVCACVDHGCQANLKMGIRLALFPGHTEWPGNEASIWYVHSLRGEAQAKSGKKEQTQGHLKKKISDMQRQIRQTTKDIAGLA